jgi:biotin operon repressor
MVGADPSFEYVHVLRALFVLSDGWTSRKRLVDELGVGEGSVRTLLKRLKDDDVVVSSRRGHRLNKNGKNLLEKISGKVSRPIHLKTLKNSCAVHMVGKNVKSGLVLRDEAVRAGAQMALVLNVSKGKVYFPEKGMDLCESMPRLNEELVEKFGSKGGVVVVCSADGPDSAENAALRVAMKFSDTLGFVTGSGLS